MIENKNALKLTMWWGWWWWWWWGERIKVVRNRVYPRAAADDKVSINFQSAQLKMKLHVKFYWNFN